MKKADIKTDGTAYLAKVSYSGKAPVVPVKVGVQRRRGRNEVMDGVRVRLPHATKVEYQSYPEGAEVVISTRALEREWTDEDEQRRVNWLEAEAKADELRERFEAIGFTATRSPRYGRDEPEPDAVVKSGGVTLTPAAAERLLGFVAEGQGAAFA